MENHPIPQDITGFQFKLIGDMTIKQFAYVAGGIIIAWLFLSSPLPLFIKLPFMIFSAGLGAGLAFLPVEGRPLDIMLINFIKALFVPERYLYEKIGGEVAIFQIPAPVSTSTYSTGQTQLTSIDDILAKMKTPRTQNKLDEKELKFFQNVTNLSAPRLQPEQPVVEAPAPIVIAPTPVVIAPQPATPPPSVPQEEKVLEERALEVAEALQNAQAAEQVTDQKTAEVAHEQSQALEKQLQEIMAQKAELEKQLMSMTKKLSQSQPVFTPSEGVNTPAPSQNVRKITKEMGVRIGLPTAPEAPNLLVGIIKDSRGNILPNILVEVQDQEGNPVRAFKTNQLGQFAAATSLLNGTYTLAFEDPGGKQKFDLIQIDAVGEPIQPIEIISTDAREDLRKDLFGA